MYLLRIILFLFLPLSLVAKQLKANINAQSAILINADTGAILYEKTPDQKCHPASLVKIATALYTLEKKMQDLQVRLTASQDAVGVISPQAKRAGGDKHPPYRLTSDGTHMSLMPGEILPLHELLHGLLIQSGNDAANVIAEYVGGTIPQFMNELNQYMKAKGCHHTVFFNPGGLPHPQQFTTARDMAKLTVEAMKFPCFREIVCKSRHPRPQTNKQPASTLVQSNRLLKRGPLFYPKAIGVKTGSINAGSNLVAAAKEGDRTLIAVILYAADAASKFRDAITLFEAAFREEMVSRTLLSKNHEHFTMAIKGGKKPLEARLIDDIALDYYPSEEPSLKAHLHWDKMKLPITEGQKVGEIRLITPAGKIYSSTPIFAVSDIEMTFWHQLGALKEHKSLILLVLGLGLIATALLLIKRKNA